MECGILREVNVNASTFVPEGKIQVIAAWDNFLRGKVPCPTEVEILGIVPERLPKPMLAPIDVLDVLAPNLRELDLLDSRISWIGTPLRNLTKLSWRIPAVQAPILDLKFLAPNLTHLYLEIHWRPMKIILPTRMIEVTIINQHYHKTEIFGELISILRISGDVQFDIDYIDSLESINWIYSIIALSNAIAYLLRRLV